MTPADAPIWIPAARRVAQMGVPFVPINGLAALPFALATEHLALPHWRAANDGESPRAA